MEKEVKKLQEMIEKRDAMEKEMDFLLNSLTQGPRAMGLSGGLVDQQGFPIGDVELILETRQSRNRLACRLKTDFEIITKEIEEAMLALHRVSLESAPSSPAPSPSQPKAESENHKEEEKEEPKKEEKREPLCYVNSVGSGSAASKAGIQKGDVVLQIGTLQKNNPPLRGDLLSNIKNVIASHSNSVLTVWIQREEEEKKVCVQLGNPPIFGCHFLESVPSSS